MRSWHATSLVIDANLGVWTFIPGPYWSPKHLRRWLDRQASIVVPSLWLYEVASALYRHQRLTGERITQFLAHALALPDEVVVPDGDLGLAAVVWAERLGQAKAYDAFYLALAERLGADFWTGDQRLYRRARQVGADFVRFVGEA